jgi:hypothetical protein
MNVHGITTGKAGVSQGVSCDAVSPLLITISTILFVFPMLNIDSDSLLLQRMKLP